MKFINLLATLACFVVLASCGSAECKFSKSGGKSSAGGNKNIEDFYRKIAKECNANPMMPMDQGCKERLLKEFSQQHSCN